MKPNPILLFAGTTEGRELALFLKKQKIPFKTCVATDYGAALLQDEGICDVTAKRLKVEEIEASLQQERYQLVIDATHPFAEVVTHNIQTACEKTATPYLRILRPLAQVEGVIYVPSIEEAVHYLSQTKGNILLTTGSKTLQAFTQLPDFKERLYVRMLPMTDNFRKCETLGLRASQLIGIQGPFSETFNQALLAHVGASYLVTKDSGKQGGLDEKIQACKQSGVAVVVIERPVELGYRLEDAKAYITKHYRHNE